MPDDLNARLDRIEKELKDLSKKVEAINEHIEGLSTDQIKFLVRVASWTRYLNVFERTSSSLAWN